MYEFIKSLDGSRLVEDNSLCNQDHVATDIDFMVGGGTYDHCSNTNSYAQTDERRHQSYVSVSVNGKGCGGRVLEDDPADHRGALSWFAQGKERRLDEAGSYGYLVEIDVSKELLRAGEPVTVRMEVPSGMRGGLAIYGRNSGRYPLDPTLVFD